MTIEQLRSEAFKLPHHERARLARELIESLDDDAELERMWYEEAERRLREIESGDAELIPAEEVFAEARARLEAMRQ